MRLRSSQFVFLLLLVCSVQHTEAYALRLILDTVPGCASNEPQHRTVNPVTGRRVCPALLLAALPAPARRLDAASRAVHTAPWSMRRPALESTAVFSFTGFLRA